MSKAEERAFERYPDYKGMDGGYVTQIHKRKVFVEGYQQAEKDNELTWEDIEAIDQIFTDVFKDGFDVITDEYYQEVLKRFKEARNGRPI